MGHNRAPVKPTCPDIDKVVRGIDEGVRKAQDVIDELGGLNNILEKLREANDALRSWGEQEAERADELESENDDLKSQLEALKDEIHDARRALELN